MLDLWIDIGEHMDAILLAAGTSRRMGAGVDKQLTRLAGKPVMIFSLERLINHKSIDRVIVTAAPGNIESITAMLADYSLENCCMVVEGGSTRQESVTCGLEHVSTERVLIHEGARPLIDDELIDRVLSINADCVVPTVPIPFTVAVGGDTMSAELERSELHNVQLPQAFTTEIIKQAHEIAQQKNQVATEDSVLVHRIGYEVVFVEGSNKNIKITHPEDLVIAERLIFGGS